MIRRRRLCRLHLADNQPTVEGVLRGRWNGHYVVELAKLLPDDRDAIQLSGRRVEVPAERVVLVQVL